jgi:hypothetical protein
MKLWKRWLVAGAVLTVAAVASKNVISLAFTPMPIQFRGAVDADKPYRVKVSLNEKVLQDEYVRFKTPTHPTADEVYIRITPEVVRIYHDDGAFIQQPCLGADRVELTIQDAKRVTHQSWRINAALFARKTIMISVQASDSHPPVAAS